MLLELIYIFNHKKNYIEYLNERNSNLRKEIRDIKSSYRENNKVKDNLFEIISKDEIIFNIYEYCDNLYAVSYKLEDNFYCDKEYSLVTYKITSTNNTEICKANVEFKNSIMELVVLDTEIETRCGHASKMIKDIINIAKIHNAKSIFGKLYINTPIGTENLIRFYEKNGFTINKEKFNMKLI